MDSSKTREARAEARPATEDRAEIASSSGKFALGFVAIAPGLIVLVFQLLDYVAVDWVCARGGWALFHVLALVSLAALAVTGVVAWRYWERAGAEWTSESGTMPASARFLSILGFGSAAFFALLVVAMWAAHFILHPCQ